MRWTFAMPSRSAAHGPEIYRSAIRFSIATQHESRPATQGPYNVHELLGEFQKALSCLEVMRKSYSSMGKCVRVGLGEEKDLRTLVREAANWWSVTD